MATDLIMPTPAMGPTPQPPTAYYAPLTTPDRPHFAHHQRSHSYQNPSHQQISPLSTSAAATTTTTMTTTTTTSGTGTGFTTGATSPASAAAASPKSYHHRQVRPMYMPAVLRPTEFPSKLPPKCADDGRPLDEDGYPAGGDDVSLRRASTSLLNLSKLPIFGLSRRSTGDGAKAVGADWDLELFPKVTAEPTRKHWKPDPESSICDDPTCKRRFNYFTRRHHCRRCGNIFCDWHSAFDVPLDQNANYNPRASPSRSCSHCFHEFKVWRSRNNSAASSAASSEAAGGPNHLRSATAPTSPIAAAGQLGVKTPEAAASVPRDWNWSTF